MIEVRPQAAVAAAALLALVACDVPGPQTTAEGRPVATLELSPRTERAYQRFLESKDIYGAIYVAPDGDGWTWYTGMFSREDAQRVASLECEWVNEEPCVRYAELLPPDGSTGPKITAQANDDFTEALKDTATGKWAAIVVNALADYGYAWGYAERGDAIEQAMAECEARAAGRRVDTDRTLRAVFDANDVYACRLLRVVEKQ